MADIITRDMERDLIAALGRPMASMVLTNLQAAQRPAGPVVNNTQPVYVANNDYDEAIDGAVVQHLTVNAAQAYFETTLALAPSTFMLYARKVSLIHTIWRNLLVPNSIT